MSWSIKCHLRTSPCCFRASFFFLYFLFFLSLQEGKIKKNKLRKSRTTNLFLLTHLRDLHDGNIFFLIISMSLALIISASAFYWSAINIPESSTARRLSSFNVTLFMMQMSFQLVKRKSSQIFSSLWGKKLTQACLLRCWRCNRKFSFLRSLKTFNGIFWSGLREAETSTSTSLTNM